MKAKKVYEFINPKTDQYELEDTIPLGTKAVKIAEIKDWFATWAPGSDYNISDDLNIKVNEYLDLEYSKVTKLPDNLHIRGNLYLFGSVVTKLPDNLHIEGSLFLQGSAVTKLSNNLHVGLDTYKDF